MVVRFIAYSSTRFQPPVSHICPNAMVRMASASVQPTTDAYPKSPVSNPFKYKYVTMVSPELSGPTPCVLVSSKYGNSKKGQKPNKPKETIKH